MFSALPLSLNLLFSTIIIDMSMKILTIALVLCVAYTIIPDGDLIVKVPVFYK